MPLTITHAVASIRGWVQMMLQKWNQQQKLIANDGEATDNFGVSVAINSIGNIAIVGAARDDIGNIDQGSVYVFTYNGSTWSQQQKITASDGSANDFFGDRIAINSIGNVIIATAAGDDIGANANIGSAYVFTYNGSTWSQQQKITASDGSANDFFGSSVAINSTGNIAIIGDSDDDIGANTDAGSAYVFTYNGSTWSQQQKITASDGSANDRFGRSVAINSTGNIAIVGSPFDDIGANSNQGSAYVFTYNGSTWNQQQKLIGSDSGAGDEFGFSVSINSTGNIAAIITRWTGPGNPPGKAYIFTYNGSTWSQQQKINLSDTYANPASISINSVGNVIIIGNPGGGAGSAFILSYDGITWNEQQTLIGNNISGNGLFGWSTGINSTGNIVIIGDQFDDIGANTNQGSAYIFISN